MCLHYSDSLVAVAEGRFLYSTNSYGQCSTTKSSSKQSILKIEGGNNMEWNKYFVQQCTCTDGAIPKDCETLRYGVSTSFS